MNGGKWHRLHGVDRGRMSETRSQAHHAVQWLARAARAFVAPQADDSHTSLTWDDALAGFTTQPLQAKARLGLKIADLTFVLLGGGSDARPPSFALDGRRDADARSWLGDRLGARGLDARALDAPSPYEIPAHAIAEGAAYNAASLTDGLSELAAWYANADVSLRGVQRQAAAHQLAASPVCCWPHHFDLASLISLPARGGKSAGSIGVGFSPGDEYYDQPYFYVSVYPEPDAASLPPLPKLAHWHSKDFMAAIAPAHNIVAAKDPKTETEAYLHDAVEAAIKVLS